MFVNISNHPSAMWSVEQEKAAFEYGWIMDIPFPNVDPYATEKEISALADKCIERIMTGLPDCVMCSGEFTLSYAIISRLLSMGIKVVAACSERVVEEKVDKDGNTRKETVFKFVKFREFK